MAGLPKVLIGNPSAPSAGRAGEDVLSNVLRTVRLSGSLQFCLMPSGIWRTEGKVGTGQSRRKPLDSDTVSHPRRGRMLADDGRPRDALGCRRRCRVSFRHVSPARRRNRWPSGLSRGGLAAEALAHGSNPSIRRRAGKRAIALRLPAMRRPGFSSAPGGPALASARTRAALRNEAGCAQPSIRSWQRSTARAAAACQCSSASLKSPS